MLVRGNYGFPPGFTGLRWQLTQLVRTFGEIWIQNSLGQLPRNRPAGIGVSFGADVGEPLEEGWLGSRWVRKGGENLTRRFL